MNVELNIPGRLISLGKCQIHQGVSANDTLIGNVLRLVAAEKMCNIPADNMCIIAACSRHA